MSSFRNIPAELKKPQQWVLWRLEKRNGKTTKVPYDPAKLKRRASSTDSRTWGTFDQAVAAFDNTPSTGVGFVFSADDPYVGVDLDGCRDPETGRIEPWAEAIRDELKSYTEVSPSGRGLHIILKGTLPPGRRKKGAIEMYDSGRFFTMTGEILSGSTERIAERSGVLTDLHTNTFGEANRNQERHSPGVPQEFSDEELAFLSRPADPCWMAVMA